MGNIVPSIAGRPIGAGAPGYVIAEVGFNHNGDVGLGLEMVDAAAEAGVDAVKFQTFTASGLTLEREEAHRAIRAVELDLEGFARLAERCRERGIAFLSTPFCGETLGLLQQLEVPAFKIASMDLDNIPFLEEVAAAGKPILLSTGMSTLREIAEAVETVHGSGNDQLILLHCISKYPPRPDEANLRTIGQLSAAFGLPVGYSDHVLGSAAVLAAVTLGAVAIEKHFTIDKGLPGPDQALSADTDEMARIVSDIRTIESALGRPCADESRPDREQLNNMRRGVYAACEIAAGTVITKEMVKIVRPYTAIEPRMVRELVGRTARRAIAREEAIEWEMV
ncbi:N-acetylneuraminate synthase family protein [Endothiovibrio diazotrophicus]